MINERQLLFNLDEETNSNQFYRKIIYTSNHMQLVLMNLLPGEKVPYEIHKHADQFVKVESGECYIDLRYNYSDMNELVYTDSKHEYHLVPGDSFIIPAGVEHKIDNPFEEELKIYTVYSKPIHKHDRYE